MNQWPSSPSVSPCRIGIGPAPTKLSQPSRSVIPSMPGGQQGWADQEPKPFCHAWLPLRVCKAESCEGVDPAAQILQVDQHNVECRHHLPGRTPHFAIQAEHRNVVNRISIVVGLDHIVLLVTLQPVLRAKSSRDIEISCRDQCIKRVLQPAVTEAGCATSATLLPASSRRNSGSESRRSIPNLIMARLVPEDAA